MLLSCTCNACINRRILQVSTGIFLTFFAILAIQARTH